MTINGEGEYLHFDMFLLRHFANNVTKIDIESNDDELVQMIFSKLKNLEEVVLRTTPKDYFTYFDERLLEPVLTEEYTNRFSEKRVKYLFVL